MRTKYSPHFSLANQVIISLTSLSPGVEGGKKIKELKPNSLAHGHTLPTLATSTCISITERLVVCGRGWERVLGLPSLICEAWVLLEPFHHHTMAFLPLFPPHFQIVIFLFHILGTSFLGTQQRQLLELPMTIRIRHTQVKIGSELVTSNYSCHETSQDLQAKENFPTGLATRTQ